MINFSESLTREQRLKILSPEHDRTTVDKIYQRFLFLYIGIIYLSNNIIS